MDETQEGKSNNETIPSPLKQIRTFQGDVANALKRQKESLFSIQQTEQLKRSMGGMIAAQPDEDEEKRKQLLMFTFGGLIFIILGVTGAWFGYREFAKRSAPPVLIAPQNRFISVQEEVEINFASTTKDTLIKSVIDNSAGTDSGSYKHLVLRQGSWEGAPIATTAEFFKKLQSSAPGNLVRAFDPLFMIGTEGTHRFILIKLTSFENSFAGMLAWEKDMPKDIGPLFDTAPLLKTIVPTDVFKDVIVKNKDVRVLNGTVGSSTEPVLLYSFFDNRMLIITDNLETLRSLLEKLTQELLSR
jgi:hypothetical protein